MVNPPGELRGMTLVFCPSFSVMREIWVHSKMVLKQSQLLFLLSADLGSQSSSGLCLILTLDECRNWLISLGSVEGNGNRLHHFKIVIYCYVQPERGKAGLGMDS